MQYESVTPKIIFLLESLLRMQNNFNMHAISSFITYVVPGLKIIGHGIPDNNLKSPCIA
jgi:hypothetical protein